MRSSLSPFVYVDSAEGGVNRRNHVRRLDEIAPNGAADCYASYQRATGYLLRWRNTHTNRDGNPTVAGFDGLTWAAYLPLDFDCEEDPDRALGWLRRALDRLAAWGVPLDAVRIYYSGHKGFHLEIPHTLLGGFAPSRTLHRRLKRAARAILGEIDFDASIYDKVRLWRLENTKHSKSGLYKIRLAVEEARTLDLAAIRRLAEQPRPTELVPELAPISDDEWLPVDELVDIWRGAAAAETQHDADDAREWRRPSDEDRDRQTVGMIALNWPAGGHDADGRVSRHADYLLPLAGFLAGRTGGAGRIAALLKAGPSRPAIEPSSPAATGGARSTASRRIPWASGSAASRLPACRR